MHLSNAGSVFSSFMPSVSVGYGGKESSMTAGRSLLKVGPASRLELLYRMLLSYTDWCICIVLQGRFVSGGDPPPPILVKEEDEMDEEEEEEDDGDNLHHLRRNGNAMIKMER
jgi:hypothetical protein